MEAQDNNSSASGLLRSNEVQKGYQPLKPEPQKSIVERWCFRWAKLKTPLMPKKAAMGFVLNKFPKTIIDIQKVSYGVVGNKEIWSVEGNMKVKTGILSSEMRPFKVQISSNEEIMAYEF